MRAKALLLLLLTLTATAASSAPATAFRVTLPQSVILEQPFDFLVEAIDGTGAVDPAYTGTVTFAALDSATPDLPPNYTFTAGDAGRHVFSARLLEYGEKSIMAVDTSNASIAGSGTTDVRFAPGPTQRLVISAPAAGNLGEPFTFTVTAAHIDGTPTGNYTGTVTFDNTGLSNPANATFTPADGGTKTFTATPTKGGEVRIRVHDVDYPLLSDERETEIACPGFTVTASNDGPVCFEEAPTLIASTSETGVSFHWFGPVGWSADGQVVAGQPRFRGTYHVVMTHPNGCTTQASTFVELSSTDPNVQGVDDPVHACDKSEKTFALFDTATNGPYTDIVWSVTGSGHVVSGQGTTSVTLMGDYDPNGPTYQWMDLYLSATNGNGCAIGNRRVESQIFVYPLPVVTIDTPSSTCPGSALTARAVRAPATSSALTYHWTIENGTITELNQTTGDIRYTVSGEGDAVLTVVVNDPYCSYAATTTVSAGPSATIASASHDICAGEQVEIPVTLTGQGPFTIGWSDGALQSGVNSSFTRTVTPNETTHYSIVSVSDANCGAGSVSGDVEVTTREAATITRQPAGTTVLRGQRATLSVSVAPDPTSVQWYRGARGDRNHPVSGGTSLELTTPPITQPTSFWAEIETGCGAVMSNAATVSISSRQRAVRHP